MMKDYSIREASERDLSVIVTFQLKMAFETEGLKLDSDTLKEGIKALLNDASKGTYYVVECKDKVIGCLLTTPEWSEWRNGTVLWIQSVYIVEDYRRKGVFKTLYLYVKHKVLADSKLKGLRLYVDKSNQNAREVYTKMGMDGHHYQLYEWLK